MELKSINPQSINHDEIDIFDLFDDVVAQWKYVFVSLVLLLVLAFTYLTTTPSSYKAEVSVTKLSPLQMQVFHDPVLKEALTTTPTATGLFNELNRLVASRVSIDEFYMTLYAESDSEVLSLIFNPNLSLERNKQDFAERFEFKADKSNNFSTISFELEDPIWVARLLNRYYVAILEQHKVVLIELIKSYKNNAIVSYKIKNKRSLADYKNYINKRIIDLSLALDMAKNSNIHADNLDNFNGLLNLKESNALFDLNNVNALFLLGIKPLTTELNFLQKMSEKQMKDKADNYRFFEQKIIQLKQLGIDINLAKFKPVATEQLAFSDFKAKVSKKLVLALATLAGLFLGVFAALIAASVVRRKNRAV